MTVYLQCSLLPTTANPQHPHKPSSPHDLSSVHGAPYKSSRIASGHLRCTLERCRSQTNTICPYTLRLCRRGLAWGLGSETLDSWPLCHHRHHHHASCQSSTLIGAFIMRPYIFPQRKTFAPPHAVPQIFY